MLSSVIAAHLFKEVPEGNEGYLTKMRAKVVSRKHLNELGKDLKLIELVRTNIPKSQFGINIHGNLFEAACNLKKESRRKSIKKSIFCTSIQDCSPIRNLLSLGKG